MPDSIAMTPAMIAPNALHGSVDSAMSALGGMDSEGFLNLLVAQLKYQSPLEPKDPGDLMTQTAVLAQLDATQQLLAVQQRELGLSQAVAAAGMLGTEVTGPGPDGMSVTGIVEGVRYTEAGPVLDVGGREVLFADVRSLRAAADADDTTDATSPDAGAPEGVVPEVGAIDGGESTVAADGHVLGTIPIEG